LGIQVGPSTWQIQAVEEGSHRTTSVRRRSSKMFEPYGDRRLPWDDGLSPVPQLGVLVIPRVEDDVRVGSGQTGQLAPGAVLGLAADSGITDHGRLALEAAGHSLNTAARAIPSISDVEVGMAL
jgi:hypothetical protein